MMSVKRFRRYFSSYLFGIEPVWLCVGSALFFFCRWLFFVQPMAQMKVPSDIIGLGPLWSVVIPIWLAASFPWSLILDYSWQSFGHHVYDKGAITQVVAGIELASYSLCIGFNLSLISRMIAIRRAGDNIAKVAETPFLKTSYGLVTVMAVIIVLSNAGFAQSYVPPPVLDKEVNIVSGRRTASTPMHAWFGRANFKGSLELEEQGSADSGRLLGTFPLRFSNDMYSDFTIGWDTDSTSHAVSIDLSRYASQIDKIGTLSIYYLGSDSWLVQVHSGQDQFSPVLSSDTY